MVTVLKRKLSGSTDWKGIKVVATGSTWTTIHTAVAWTTAGTFDEIWLWVTNNDTSAVNLTIWFGWETDPDNLISMSIPSKTGLYQIVPWYILQNWAVVTAYASAANKLVIYWFVNTITDA